jgi:hypothetical protein
MNCPRESEIYDAIAAARWPDACEEELRAHASSCAGCADLVLITTSMAGDGYGDIAAAHVPTSGVVWWRIQRREREEAARAASRTITILQASSIAAAIALALTILGGVSAMNDSVRSWFSHALQLTGTLQWDLVFLGAVVMTLALAPVALYFAFSED